MSQLLCSTVVLGGLLLLQISSYHFSLSQIDRRYGGTETNVVPVIPAFSAWEHSDKEILLVNQEIYKGIQTSILWHVKKYKSSKC